MPNALKIQPYLHLASDNSIESNLRISQLASADYLATHEAMLNRTLERIALKKQQALSTDDELWVVEHNDVYTLGQAGKEEHILQKSNTPVIKTDRGGQVTWHGKGQLVIYWLFDLNKLNWKVRDLVSHAEQSIEDVVNQYLPDTLMAKARTDAPGVYIYQKAYQKNASGENIANSDKETGDMLGKIASLGFKIKQGYSYHGIALNVNCDLSAFNLINPCGYAGMQMLRLADLADCIDSEQVTQDLVDNISRRNLGEIPLRS